MQLILRPYQSGDVESLVKHANNINIANNLTNKFPFPYTKEDGEAFIAFCNSKTPVQVKAILFNNEVIGSIGVHQLEDIYSKSAELGYWIGEPFWGKGIVVNAVKQMLIYGFQTFDIDRIFARTTQTNFASQKVLLKAGFKLEAQLQNTIFKNGKYFDECIFGFRKASFKTESEL